MIGGTGNNLLDGGTGSDTADYSSSAHSVFAILNNGGGAVRKSTIFSLTRTSRRIPSSASRTSPGRRRATGSIGDANSNVINGGGGDDSLNGGTGGDDMIHGGDGNDSINASGLGVMHLFGDAGNDMIFSGNGNDVIDGGTGNDEIFSGGGNDTITGGDGDDWIEGGEGADTMDGGSGINTLDYQDSLGGVEINLATGTGSADAATGDTFSNFQNVFGSDHNDLLIGSNQDNVLFERFGTNTLIGGGGHDTFAVMDFTESHNTVLDFHIGEDKLAIVGQDTMADMHFTQTMRAPGVVRQQPNHDPADRCEHPGLPGALVDRHRVLADAGSADAWLIEAALRHASDLPRTAFMRGSLPTAVPADGFFHPPIPFSMAGCTAYPWKAASSW